MDEEHLKTMGRLADTAFALQKLRYLSWMVVKAYDDSNDLSDAIAKLREVLPIKES
jgi:hypothetical protein